MPVAGDAVDGVRWMGEVGLDDREGLPPSLEPLLERTAASRSQEFSFDRPANVRIWHGRRGDYGFDPGDVPAVLSLAWPDDGSDLGREEGLLQRTSELATADIERIAAISAAARITPDAAGDILQRFPRFQPADDLVGRYRIPDKNVADASGFGSAIEIGIPFVIRPNLALWNGNGVRHEVHEPGDRPSRGRGRAVLLDARAPTLEAEYRFSHQVPDDPAPQGRRRCGAVRRHMSAPWSSPDLGQPRLQS